MFNEKNKDKLMKHLNKKGVKDLDPLEKEAKLGVVGELSRQAHSMLGDKIHPSKKVSVASNTKEGLKAGLAKAAGLVDHTADPGHDPEKIVEGAEEEMHADLDHDNEEGEGLEHAAKVAGGLHNPEGSPEEEALESPEQEALEQEHADKSPEELDAHIEKLTALKHKKMAGKA